MGIDVVGRIRRFPWKQITVEPALFLMVFASGLSSPANKAVLYRKVCLNIYNTTGAPWNPDVMICDRLRNSNYTDYQNEVQRHTSQWEFYENLCANIPMVLTIGLYGSWSDRFSRQIPLLLCPIGSFLLSANYLLNAIFMEAPPGFILIGSLVYGFSGGFVTFLMASFSYLSATVSSEAGRRTSRISTAYASQSIGMAISYAISGVILDNTNFVVVYSIVLLLYLTLIAYIVLRLPNVKNPDDLAGQNDLKADSMQTDFPTFDRDAHVDDLKANSDNRKFEESGTSEPNGTANPKLHDDPQIHSTRYLEDTIKDPKNAIADDKDAITDLKESKASTNSLREMSCGKKCVTIFGFQHTITSLMVIFKKRSSYTRLAIILVVSTIFSLIVTNANGVSYLFYMHDPLNWSQSMYGYYTGYHSLVGFTANLFMLPLLKTRFHVADEVLLVVGMGCEMAGRIWLGFCRQTWMVFLTPIIMYTCNFNFSCMRGLVSAMVNHDEYGKMFAVIAWLECIGGIIAGYLFNELLYPRTVSLYAGFSFFISGFLTIVPVTFTVCLLILLRRYPILRKETTYVEFVDEDNNTTDPAQQANDIILVTQQITEETG